METQWKLGPAELSQIREAFDFSILKSYSSRRRTTSAMGFSARVATACAATSAFELLVADVDADVVETPDGTVHPAADVAELLTPAQVQESEVFDGMLDIQAEMEEANRGRNICIV